jgi:hypothetical protein
MNMATAEKVTDLYDTLTYKLKRASDFVRYDIPRVIKNVYRFRKTLYHARPYDYSGLYYAIRDNLEGMEKSILEGCHVGKEVSAKEVHTTKLLLDRILDDHQDSFDRIKMNFHPIEGSQSSRVSFEHTPLYSEAPRHSKLQYKILKSKEENNWDLLFKILKTKSRGWWS